MYRGSQIQQLGFLQRCDFSFGHFELCGGAIAFSHFDSLVRCIIGNQI